MKQIINFLKELGILKIGGETAVGSADKLNNLSVREYGPKKGDSKKTRKKQKRKRP